MIKLINHKDLHHITNDYFSSDWNFWQQNSIIKSPPQKLLEIIWKRIIDISCYGAYNCHKHIYHHKIYHKLRLCLSKIEDLLKIKENIYKVL